MLKWADMLATHAECIHLAPFPQNQNRKVREWASLECAKRLRKMTTARIPKVGRAVAFLHYDNYGTKKFPDIRRSIHFAVIDKITPCYVFTSDGCRIEPEDIICVGVLK